MTIEEKAAKLRAVVWNLKVLSDDKTSPTWRLYDSVAKAIGGAAKRKNEKRLDELCGDLKTIKGLKGVEDLWDVPGHDPQPMHQKITILQIAKAYHAVLKMDIETAPHAPGFTAESAWTIRAMTVLLAYSLGVDSTYVKLPLFERNKQLLPDVWMPPHRRQHLLDFRCLSALFTRIEEIGFMKSGEMPQRWLESEQGWLSLLLDAEVLRGKLAIEWDRENDPGCERALYSVIDQPPPPLPPRVTANSDDEKMRQDFREVITSG